MLVKKKKILKYLDSQEPNKKKNVDRVLSGDLLS